MDDSDDRLEAVRSVLLSSNESDDEEERLERVRKALQQSMTRIPEPRDASVLSPIPHLRDKPTSNAKKPSSGRRAVTSVSRQSIDSGRRTSMANREADSSRTSGSSTPSEVSEIKRENIPEVFNRLYEMHKQKSTQRFQNEQQFRPQIDKRSRAIAMQTERLSLYERAVQQRFRQESARETLERQEREDRSRSKTLQTSQQLAWNRLRRDIERMFVAKLISENADNDEADKVIMALDKTAFVDILRQLNLHEVGDELFDMLAGEEDGRVQLETFCGYMKNVSFPEPENAPTDDFSVKVKRLLIGRKAAINNAGLERVIREVAAETPFSPQITQRSRELDEKRFARMGIDPNLPRSEKIHAEIKLQADKKETLRTSHTKKELEHCTFRPRTNSKFTPTGSSPVKRPNSASSSTDQEEVPAKSKSDVGSRLYRDSIERRNRLMQKKEERVSALLRDQEMECTFRPKTNSTKVVNLDPAVSRETLFRAKAFDSSVDRLKAWREKHVIQEDTADLMFATRRKQENLAMHHRVFSKELTYGNRRPVLFEADVALPHGGNAVVQVRQNEDLVRTVGTFAKRHGLDKVAESVLLKTLQQSMREQQAMAELGPPPDNNFGDDDVTDEGEQSVVQEGGDEVAEDEDEASFLVIDVVVRPGETYELRLSRDDDPMQVAHEFADDVGMDTEARDRLVESLMQLQN